MQQAPMDPGTVGTAERGPLSFQQEVLVERVRRFPACAPTLDLSYVFRIDGYVDLVSLEMALADLQSRHPALRTTVEVSGSGDVQRVRARPEPVSRGTFDSERALLAAVLLRRLDANAILSGARLFRPLVACVDGRVYLALSCNHLVHDGWSYLVICRDLSELYQAHVEGRRPRLPSLRETYVAFSRAQRTMPSRTQAVAARMWASRVAQLAEDPPWASGRISAGRALQPSVRARFSLDARAVRAARDLAVASHAPPFLGLLASTALAVARQFGQRVLLTGSNAANREGPGRLDAVGYYTNTRLAWFDLRAEPELVQAVRAARDEWLTRDEVYDDLYASELLRELGDRKLLKVNLLNLPGLSVQRPLGAFTGHLNLHDADVERVPLATELVHWRPFEWTWVVAERGYDVEVWHRLPFARRDVEALVEEVASILGSRVTVRPPLEVKGSVGVAGGSS